MQDLRGAKSAITESRVISDHEKRGLRVQAGVGQGQGFDVLINDSGMARFLSALFACAADLLEQKVVNVDPEAISRGHRAEDRAL